MKITITNLYRIAKKFIGALVKYAALPVTHISQSTLTAALKAAKAKRSAHIAAIRATRVAVTKQKSVREIAIAFATACRDALVPELGRDWSSAWVPAGWKNKLSVPRTLEDLEQLLEDLHQFLTDNPGLQDDKRNLTIADVQDMLARLEAAAQGLSAAKTAQRQARTAREAADAALMDEARGLVSELDLILPESDERWIEFVGEVPSDEQRPEPVEAVVLSADVPGELDVDWEGSVRAERYQVCVLVVGVDQDYRHVTTVKDTNATISNLPPGAVVKVRVVAANAAGEAAPSDEETATVLALPKAA